MQIASLAARRRRPDPSQIHVHVIHRRLDEACAAQSGPYRLRTVPELERTGARLEEQRRDHEVVVAADQRDRDVVTRTTQLLQTTRRRDSPETASEYDYVLHGPSPSLRSRLWTAAESRA